MTTLGIGIMMKNESAIIERCLESVVDVADKVIILDTGSTDDSVFKAAIYLQNKGISFRIYSELFIDFAHSRTRLLELCRQEQDLDYILMIDADEVLVVGDNFQDTLQDFVYDINLMTGGIGYNLPRLTSNKITLKYKGVTHEFLDAGHYPLKFCPYFTILQVNDSFRRINNFKHKNDIELLTEALKTCGDEEMKRRYTFYLAQSYFALDELDKAANFYHKRTQQGGWIEEVFYSYYVLGLVAEKQNDEGFAIKYHLMAYETCPYRIESIAALKRLFDTKGLIQVNKNLLLPILKSTPHPNIGLFLENHLYYAYK